MSIIPKINISTPFNKKSRDRMNFDCQTTGNIGSVQPTLCRELVPDETFHVSNKTLVRLASMPVPTFGRLSQRDYYTFVRMSDMYEPWANFLAGQPFTPSSGSAFTPTSLPYFSKESFNKFLVEYSYSWFLTGDKLSPIVIDRTTQFMFLQNLFKYAVINDFYFNPLGNSYGLWFSSPNIDDPFSKGGFLFSVDDTNLGELVVGCKQIDSNGDITSTVAYSDKFPTTTYEGADFILYLPASNFSGYSSFTTAAGVVVDPASDGLYIAFKLKPIAKHLRQIAIGCGYQFNPWENPSIKFNPYKLFGFYKSWFDLMRPVRDIQFTNTNCYRCLKIAESSNNYNFSNIAIFDSFLLDLAFDTYYYTQPDYFSMAIPSLGDNSLTSGSNQVHILGGNTLSDVVASESTSFGHKYSSGQLSTVNSSLLIQGILKLLRFTSKNNIIGRSIREYAKVHYGIDDLQQQNHEVTRIGVSRVDIAFDEVMSNAETAEGSLGEYAGKGIGFKESEKFDFTAKDFGYIFCLTVLVPESGYYQGYLAENTHLDKYQFFMPEFDALGYQVLQQGEIKSDFEISSPNLDPSQYSGNSGFGFVPRYSEYKVSRNIVNGDLTLRSSRNGLEGYYLDKRFPSYKESSDPTGKIVINAPDFIPNSSSLGFRKIDPTDNVGNYNRIFNYTYIDADHFIIQKVFNVEVNAPWKSLSNSFDTIQEGEVVVERNHQ